MTNPLSPPGASHTAGGESRTAPTGRASMCLGEASIRRADTWEEVACRGRGARHVRVWPHGVAGDAFLARMAGLFLAATDDAAGAPVLAHCVAGCDRTGTACAVYRMEYDVWGPDRAAAEMRAYRFDPDRDAAAGAYRRFVRNYRTRARRAAGEGT